MIYKKYILTILLLLYAFISPAYPPAKIDSLKDMLKNISGLEKVRILNELGKEYMPVDHNISLGLFKEAYDLAIELNENIKIGNSLYNLASVYHKQGKYQESIKQLLEAKEIFTEAGDNEKLILAINELADIHRAIGDFKRSLKYYDQSLKIARETVNNEKIYDILLRIGELHDSYNNKDKALEHYFHALAILKETGNRKKNAEVLTKIGKVYYKKNDYQNSLKYYSLSLDNTREINSKDLEAECMTNISLLYAGMNSYDVALKYLDSVYDIYTDLGNNIKLSECFLNKSFVYLEKEEYNTALEYCNKSYKVSDRIDNFKGMINSLNRTADVYRSIGKYGKALKYYYESIEQAKRHIYQDLLINNYIELSRTYTILNEYGKASKYLSLSESLKDSISYRQNLKHSAELEFIDKVEEKEQEILNDKYESESTKGIEEEIDKDTILIYFLIFIIIVFFVVAYAVYDTLKKRKIRGDELIKRIDHEMERMKTDPFSEEKVLESLDYTKQIQESIRPSIEYTKQLFPNSFIFYEPRKNVGGDFYWFEKKKNNIYVATVDCSGYGISMAFLSHITHNILNSSLKERSVKIPANILNDLNMDISYRFHKDIGDKNIKKIIKISLCLFNMKNHSLQYAGANSPVYIIRNEKLIELETDPLPVGTYIENTANKYNNYEFELKTGDTIYMFTDGFSNQLSLINEDDENNERFKLFLLDIHSKPMNEQKDIFKKTIVQWEEEIDQMDDILVIGLKV